MDVPYQLYNKDCREVMPTLKDISAVITDPPYGVEYRGHDWDKEIPNWLSMAQGVSKCIIFTTGIATLWQYPPADWVGCWHNIAGASRSKLNGFNHWTPILFYGKPVFAIDTFETKFGVTVNENKGIDHPSPKPLRLMRWLIENSTSPDDVIFDPFMGSGTTGVAALQLGRRFIGCEIDPKYFAIAESRIQSAALRPALLHVAQQSVQRTANAASQQASFITDGELPSKARGATRRR